MNFGISLMTKHIRRFVTELEAQLLKDWDPVEIEKQVRASQKARMLIDQVTEGQWRKLPNK